MITFYLKSWRTFYVYRLVCDALKKNKFLKTCYCLIHFFSIGWNVLTITLQDQLLICLRKKCLKEILPLCLYDTKTFEPNLEKKWSMYVNYRCTYSIKLYLVVDFICTPSQKHNGTFSEICKPFIKKWRVPYTFILLEATVKLWLMFSTSVPTQNDIKT